MSNGNNSADTGRGTDAVKIDEAGRLKKRLKCWESAVTIDVSNCIKKLPYFEANYENDLAPTGNQIELAIDILNTHSRAKARFKTLETGMEDLKMLTCENWEAADEEIEKPVEKIDTDLTLYGKKLFDIKIIHNKVKTDMLR